VHVVPLAAALALLPITPNDSWKPQGAGNPTLHILALLAISIGVPYFALSASGPLVQHWFSRSRPGVSPYRLYALCERKKRATEALSYNGLVQSWPEIMRLARESGGKPVVREKELFDAENEEE
jgi:hypothetical protein